MLSLIIFTNKKEIFMDLKIKSIVAERLDVDVNTLNGEEDLLYLVYNDYMEFAEIIYQIEEEFNINISDEDCLKLKTINDVINYVKDILK